MNTLEEKIINMVKQQIGNKEISVTLDSKFEDINADSLDIVELALRVEDEFNIEIPEDNAENIETVRDVVRIVKTLVDAK